MSRTTVRATIVNWMKAHPVTDLNTVMGFFPRDLAQAGIQFTSGAPGVVSGAIAVVFIGNQTEEPKAFDGAGGGRQTTYIANIQIYHRSAEPDPNDAQTNFDAIMVSLLDLFRTDPQMGQAHDGPIINMAYEHLTVDYGEPEQAADDSGALLTWATISFPVLEWNQVT